VSKRLAVLLLCTAPALGAAAVIGCGDPYGSQEQVDGADGSPESASSLPDALDGAAADGAADASCFALALDGNDDAVDVPYQPDFDVARPFTVEAWIRRTSVQAEQQIVSHHSHDMRTGFMLFAIGTEADADIGAAGRVYGPDAGLFPVGFGPGSSVPVGVWKHVAFVADVSELRIYVDGMKRDSTLGAPPDLPASYTGVLRIGAASEGGNFAFGGAIDEVRLSSVARYAADNPGLPSTPFVVDSDTIALWHFDEGAGSVAHDETGEHDGTLVRGASWTPAPCGAAR
jgi:hypothetical protein